MTNTADTSGSDRGAATAAGALFTIAVVLTAVNLRPAMTSVGLVLDEVRQSFEVSAAWVGLLTSVPVLCFALAGLTTPMLARRTGRQPRSASLWACWGVSCYCCVCCTAPPSYSLALWLLPLA